MRYVGCYNMSEDKSEREVDAMSIMKPIQATPELSGVDFAKLLNQTKSKPTAQAMKKNNMLHGVHSNIRKK